MPSRCEPASLVLGGGVGGLGGEKERGGGGLGNGEGRLLWGRGCTVVNGVGQLGFGGLP